MTWTLHLLVGSGERYPLKDTTNKNISFNLTKVLDVLYLITDSSIPYRVKLINCLQAVKMEEVINPR